MGVRRIFVRISPNLPENFWANFCALHEDRILDDLQKTSSCDFGRHFLKSKHVGRHLCIFGEFAQIFRDFAKVFTDFVQISLDFAGFSPNQNFWG